MTDKKITKNVPVNIKNMSGKMIDFIDCTHIKDIQQLGMTMNKLFESGMVWKEVQITHSIAKLLISEFPVDDYKIEKGQGSFNIKGYLHIFKEEK